MKLYITPGSPYARIARIVILEKGLESRVEVIVAQSRDKGWHDAFQAEAAFEVRVVDVFAHHGQRVSESRDDISKGDGLSGERVCQRFEAAPLEAGVVGHHRARARATNRPTRQGKA